MTDPINPVTLADAIATAGAVVAGRGYLRDAPRSVHIDLARAVIALDEECRRLRAEREALDKAFLAERHMRGEDARAAAENTADRIAAWLDGLACGSVRELRADVLRACAADVRSGAWSAQVRAVRREPTEEEVEKVARRLYEADWVAHGFKVDAPAVGIMWAAAARDVWYSAAREAIRLGADPEAAR